MRKLRSPLAVLLGLLILLSLFPAAAFADDAAGYTVAYDANGGYDAPDAQTKLPGVPLRLDTRKPLHEEEATGAYTVTLDPCGGEVSPASLTSNLLGNYDFLGWNDDPDGFGTPYDPGDSYADDADLTLYAQWELASEEAEAVELPVPERLGFAFLGWAEDPDAQSGVTGSYVPEDDVTLCAIWGAAYTVSYDANGGSDAPDAQTKLPGEPLALSDEKPVHGEERVGAYTVTLEPCGGSVSPASLTSNLLGCFGFTGWNDDPDGFGTPYDPGESYTGDADLRLYAQWELASEEAEAVELPDPERFGFSFLGWAEDPDAQSGVTGSFVPEDDVTLYAIWEGLSGWREIDGKRYYFLDGQPAVGWKKLDGAWYFFAADGVMKTGWVKDGGKWYYLNAAGVMKTGWVKDGGKWYYMNSSGAMQTGWVKVGGTWYYMNSSGAMQTGWQKIGGKWYYFLSSGAMKTGWLKDGGKWYYLDSSGAMLASTSRTIGGKTYHFNSSGVCTNP